MTAFNIGDHVVVVKPDRPPNGFDPNLVGETGIVQQYDVMLNGAMLYTVLFTTGELEPLYEVELAHAGDGVTA